MSRAKSLRDPAISPVRQDNALTGFILSVLLHAAVIGAFWITLPYWHHETQIQPPLIVDLVPIDEITAAPPKPPQPQPETQPEPPKPPEKEEPPKEQPPPPPPETPPPPKPEPAPPPPPETPPPPPKPEPPKPKNNDIAQLQQLLKNIEKQQPQKPQSQTPPPPTTAPVNNQAAALSDRATMTELDAIRHHIEDCWRIDPGEEGIENLSAEIRVFINPDGSVQRADILDMTRYFTDPQFRTFATSARIAVLSCKGIPISPQHYDQLKEMILNFSPQGRVN